MPAETTPARMLLFSLLMLCLSLGLFRSVTAAEPSDKPRLVVLTDIGGDPDDEQSLVRLLLYANELDIEAIVAEHWAGRGHHNRTPQEQMEIIDGIIAAYEKVQGNLARHDPAYPIADILRQGVKRGLTNVGGIHDEVSAVDAQSIIGPGKDTPGSEWLIELIDRPDERPVNVSVWGGPADLAQALWRVRETRTPQQLAEFVSRIRVHAISDQDATGPWIRENFPELFYVFGHSPGGNKWNSCYRGMFLGGDMSLTSRDWVQTHVTRDHGPLGALYPLRTATGANPHGCLKEGDTPSWFYFLPLGLHDPTRPEYGGWGGRYTRNGTFYQDAEDTVDGVTSGRATVWRWRPDFQADFQARLDWCVRSPDEANHRPIAAVDGDTSGRIVHRQVRPGDAVELSAAASSDPDGDGLSYRWWIYPEAGNYDGQVSLQHAESKVATLKVPRVEQPREIHMILNVRDDADPALTAYRRVVLKIDPAGQ